ncbi:MAG TPA: serine--tRNA ligase [Firmicutes bacterium]|nr:serine--tRNA ligase [Bacillota bacterium]
MIDIKLIREDSGYVKKKVEARNINPLIIDEIIEADAMRRELIAEADLLKAENNRVSKEVAMMKKEGKDAAGIISDMKSLNEKIKKTDAKLAGAQEVFLGKMLLVPNLQHDSAPVGKDETQNVKEREWGEKPGFEFKPRPHWEIAEHLDILDNKRAAKIAGARFTLYKGAGALMERALINFMLDVQTREHGYTEVMPPLMVNADTLTGSGQLPKFEKDLFKIENSPYYLIPTSEVPIVNIFRDEILKEKDLPVCYAAYTPCFRSEAGSYGKDVKGIIRMHQFNKVEMIKFVHPDTSWEEHEKMADNAEEILRRLNLHYRVLLLCTGDAGDASAKTYDIETWHAGAEVYRETSSVSNCTDWQSRRAKIRFKDRANKVRFVHTLNGSGLATSRLLPAILEAYQTENMEVIVPEALRPYMGGVDKISKR